MGLQTSAGVWLACGVTCALWALSALVVVRLLRGSVAGWRVLPLSVFGFAWVAFGVTFAARFAALAYDAELFQATLFPPWLISTKVLQSTWWHLALFWVSLCGGVALVLAVAPRRAPRLLSKLNRLDRAGDVAPLDLLACCTTAGMLVLFNMNVPSSLRTPIGHASSLWVIPATLAWYMHFRGDRMGLRKFLYLAPGIIIFLISPYREHLLTLFLCVALPAIQVRRRIGLPKTAALTIVVLIASTIVLYIYRPVRWEGEDWSAARRYANWGSWRETPESAPWTRLSLRFHGFDSAALTFWLVPETFPRHERHPLTELAVSTFLPRALYADKAFVQRGRLFSTSIWAYDRQGEVIERGSAMIAPSMPGDLWAIGGLTAIAAGAFAWGALVGLLESWRRGLRSGPALALVVFMAFRIAGGLERDFVHATATVVQVLIVLALVLAVLPVRGAARSPARGHVKRGGARGARLPQGRPTEAS